MNANLILHDYGPEGLEIDVSTRTYPNKSILIDRDVYDFLDGKITANGEKYMILTKSDGSKVYLGRHILGLDASDPLKIIHKDGLRVDYRRCNLDAVLSTEIKHIKHKTVRDIHLALIRKRLKEYELEELKESEILNAVDDFFDHFQDF